MNTPDATEALELLAPYVRPKLVVAQFRHHIVRERANDHEKEDQRQVLRATFPWIRNSIKELIGTEMDALARDFPDMHVGIVCKPNRMGSIVEVQKNRGGKF